MEKIFDTFLGVLMFLAVSYGLYIYYVGVQSTGSYFMGVGALVVFLFVLYYSKTK